MSRLAENRRRFLLSLGSLAVCGAACPQAIDAQTTDADSNPRSPSRRPSLLQAPQGIEKLGTRSRMVVQLSGQLTVADPDPSSKKPPRKAEIKAESTVDYDELLVYDSADSILAAARDYHEATVKSWVAGHASSHTLAEACRDTRVVRQDGVWQQYCPSRSMQPREVDLVRLPINSVVIDELLPATPVKADSRWSPKERTLAELFHLEAVHSSTLSLQVAKVEKGVATIECEGEVEGTVNSVPTKLKLSGNLHATLGSQCALVSWAGLSLIETREISQAEPGFALTARIELIRKEEAAACANVSDRDLRELAASDDEGRWLLNIASVAGRYQFLADRRWRTIVDTGEESILRLVDKNQVVAQCNITRLPSLAAGQQLTLAGMQDDIKRSLGDNLESMLEASERKNSAGLRVLRTVVIGKSSDVPVRWVYTHLSDDTGRRVSLVFTMSGEAAEEFGLADEQMTGSLELLPEPSGQEPTPAVTQDAPTKAAAGEASPGGSKTKRR